MKRLFSCALILCLLFTACGKSDPVPKEEDTAVSTADTEEMDLSFSDRDTAGTYDETAATVGNITEITAAGTYILTGDITQTVTVDAGENDKIQLVLDNVRLSVKDGPAIYVRAADKVFITAKDGTENAIEDGSDYTVTDGETAVDAAIFSKADLTLNGGGTLTVNGNCKHAVVSKDDLVITVASLTVTAKNVGLNGKDCVKVSDSIVTVDAGSDGIRSDNTEDAARGFVYLTGCTLDIAAGNDGVQAETLLKAENATATVLAGGGSGYGLSYNNESYKGLKAGSDILLADGSYTIDSKDDCIHSNNTVSITDGTFSLTSGDDGVHADNDLGIAGGTVTVHKSYEGLEATRIVLSGGTVSVNASDDGLNAAGGNDASGMGGRPGQGVFARSDGSIIISGGYTTVNASGDGIDSNGTLTVTGGVTLVSGPTNSGNGAFDYDGSATVSGGVLIALGSAGMAQGFSATENQGAVLCAFDTQAAGTSFALCSSETQAVVSFTPSKTYGCAVVTAPGIKKGETYTVVCGGTVSGADQNGYAENAAIDGGTAVLTIEMTDTLYNGVGGGMGDMGGHGGMGGGPGGPGGMGRPW